MKSHAKIKVSGSNHPLHIENVKEELVRYATMVSKTGDQLDWNYAGAAFPYEIVPLENDSERGFHLRGTVDRYKHIVIGCETVTTEATTDETDYSLIHVFLLDLSTDGDKGKANEFCKYLAKSFKGELHLFNGRVLRYSNG